MAKASTGAAPSYEPMKPRAGITWDPGSVETEGDFAKLGVGKKVHLVVQGEVSGYSHNETYCSLDVKVTGLELAPLTRAHGRVGTAGVRKDESLEVEGKGRSAKEERAEGEGMVSMIGRRRPSGRSHRSFLLGQPPGPVVKARS